MSGLRCGAPLVYAGRGGVMKLLVVGGKLQGTEACYLAAQAGWQTVLVDRRRRRRRRAWPTATSWRT